MPVVNETSENGKIMGAIMLKYLRKCWILNYSLSGKQQEQNHLSIYSFVRIYKYEYNATGHFCSN